MTTGARRPITLGALRWALIALVLSTVSCEEAVVETDVVEPPAVSEAPAPAPGPPPTPTLEPCNAGQKESIEQSITAQAESLAAGDWEGAYSYASPSFRSAVTIDQFEQVILGQYDMLLSFESAQFGRCEVLASRAAIMNVEVLSGLYQPVIMVYEMVASDGAWFVNGVAVPTSAVPNA